MTNPPAPPENVSDDCAALLTLIPAYSIGATDPDETAWVEKMLPGCSEATAELQTYRALETELLLSARHPNPPPISARVMAAISAPQTPKQTGQTNRTEATTPIQRAAPAAPGIVKGTRSITTAPQHSIPAATISLPTAAQPRRNPFAMLGWVAAGVALLALVFTNIYWANLTADRERTQVAIIKLASGIDTRRVQLTSADTVPNSSAEVLYSPDGRRAVLVADNWQRPPVGRTFQLWLIADGQPRSLGTFLPDEQGDISGIIELPDSPDAQNVFAITEEPTGGSPQPTTNPFIVGQVS